MALRQNQTITDKGTGNRPKQGLLGDNGFIPTNMIGANTQVADGVIPDVQSALNIPAPTQEQLNNIAKAMANDTTNRMIQAGAENPDYTPFNLNANMIYGYGTAPRDLDPAYSTPIERPEGYSATTDFLEEEDPGLLEWYYRNLDHADNRTRDEFNRYMQVLENQEHYRRNQALLDSAEEMRQRNLYGDTLVDLLQNTPQGQSILDYIPAKHLRGRERHITGSAAPGSTDYWTMTGLEPANESLW